MLDHLWDFFVDTLKALFMPMVCSYFVLCGDLFLNTSIENATGLEKAGNILLTPLQYIVAGREAIQNEDGSWRFVQRFDYNTHFVPKAIASTLSLPFSLVLGSAVKGLAYLDPKTRARHQTVLNAKRATTTHSQAMEYERIGMQIGNVASADWFTSEDYLRKPGDEKHLSHAKEALREIASIFNEANIPWWVDCGTLLGVYRYGGVIPWDGDIDLSILVSDFENAKAALNQLDPKKYIVQDWSGRDYPNTYFKVYVRESGDLIDIDTYAIDAEKKELSCIFSMEKNIFCFEWWKIREGKFKNPIAFDDMFPLKKGWFDGIEVSLPQNPKKFLQRYYGENLAPAKIYDPITQRFEKDLSHPYWQGAYVH